MNSLEFCAGERFCLLILIETHSDFFLPSLTTQCEGRNHVVITCERCDALGLNVASNVACSPLLMMTDAACARFLLSTSGSSAMTAWVLPVGVIWKHESGSARSMSTCRDTTLH